VEQIQVIAEKEMTSKLLKHFTIRTMIYSFLYFATVVVFFIFEPIVRSTVWSVLLITAINILFLMVLSKQSTTEAFNGINTTSAPRQSLKRISNVAAIPMFIFTCIFSFMDVIFLHSLFDTSDGYTASNVTMFAGIVIINIVIWLFVVNVYEKRILKKYLTIEEAE